jgi:hypothetical protein
MFRKIGLMVCAFLTATFSGCLTVTATARVGGTQPHGRDVCLDKGVEPGVYKPCSQYEIEHHLNGC